MAPAQQHLGTLAVAADHGVTYRDRGLPLHPTASTEDLRAAFRVPLPDGPRDGAAVISDPIAAAEPGLVSRTDNDFYGSAAIQSSKAGCWP